MAISDSSVEFECPSFPSEYQPSAIEPNLRWYCQDAVLFPQPEGRLEELLQAYKEAPARQRQASLAVWFSETCLGIARALNNAHEIILDSPAEAIKSAAEFKWRRVGYGNLGTREVMFFDTSKSSEALFPTFYNITSFGLRDNDLTKSAARCRTEFLHRAITEYSYAPEFRVCSEVSLSSDIWALGVLFLHLTAWYLRGFSSVVAGKTFEIVEDSVGGQPGAKISSRIAGVSVKLEKGQAPCVSIAELIDRLIGNHTTL